MTMLGISSNLADGFPMIPPPINPEDESDTDKGPGPQHPFVSHDVTEDDWLKFLAGIKAVASNPNQGQRSFLARVFLSEMSEKDQRKRATHFVNSWNHYFFKPRRLIVILARGRKVYGASDYQPRQRSVSVDRGRDTDPTQTKDQRRSRSTDSSSSRHSARSIVSEPSEIPAPREPTSEKPPTNNPSDKHEQWWKMRVGSAVTEGIQDIRNGIYEGIDNLRYGVNLGLYNLHQGLNEGFDNVDNGLRSAFGNPGSSTGPQNAGSGTDRDSKEARKAQKDEWKVQQDELKRQRDAQKRDPWKQEWKPDQKGGKPQDREMKPERKLTKDASNDEKGQEGKGKCRDQPWKLIIFYDGPRGET